MKRTIWRDLPSKETPLTADELNRIEDALVDLFKFRETRINGKTGDITREDILALGIPIEDGRYMDRDNLFIGKNRPKNVPDIVL